MKTNPADLKLRLILPLLLLATTAGRAEAQANDMFPTRAAALERARELHCSGAFAMGKEWMPCKDFASYQQAVSRES